MPVNLPDLAKSVTALLGTASVVAYIGGYLALRARSFALGTDPSFKLVDQAYVFAGFRFLFVTLIVLLLSAPVIALLRLASLRLVGALPERLVQPAEWSGLLILIMLTVASLRIFSADGVLLRAGPVPVTGIEAAVLGGAEPLRLGLAFGIVLLAGLSTLWFVERLPSHQGPFEVILAAVVALQLFMLPIYHGALFADRRVRVLSLVPGSVRGLVAPVAIVDRAGEQVTLLGTDGAGHRRLTAIDPRDLNGIPVRGVVPIEDFLAEIAAKAKDPDRSVRGIAMAQVRSAGEPLIMVEEKGKFEKGFYGSLVDYLGMIFESIGSLGGGDMRGGELWTVELDKSGHPAQRRRVGLVDDISWPVADVDGRSFIALQRGRVVRLDENGALAGVLDEGKDWRKLLGILEDGSVLGLIRQDHQTRPATLAPDGTPLIGAAPSTDEEKKAVARLLQEARAYRGGWALVVDRSDRGGRGFDLFLRTAENTYNLSDCGDDLCGQPSLAPDFRRVVFIRVPRY